MLEPAIKTLASEGKNFGALSFRLPSGRIATHIMWVDADDDHLIINTEVDRSKFGAIEADPRVTVTVWKADNPYAYGEVRGTVVETIRGPEARAHIDALSMRYTEQPYSSTIGSERVILKIRPDRQRAKSL